MALTHLHGGDLHEGDCDQGVAASHSAAALSALSQPAATVLSQIKADRPLVMRFEAPPARLQHSAADGSPELESSAEEEDEDEERRKMEAAAAGLSSDDQEIRRLAGRLGWTGQPTH